MTATPGTPVPTTPVPPPPGIHLITPELVNLSDAELHARITELRDAHQAHVDFYNRWLGPVRGRIAHGKSERHAAKAMEVSRATVRKAAAKKVEPRKPKP